MTTKNKKSAQAKAKKVTKSEEEDVPVTASSPEPGMKNFTRAQIAGIVFVSIGYSKIMEFSTAMKQGTEDPQKCLAYLGKDNFETCTHPSFPSLVQVKFYSAFNFTAMVTFMGMLLWSSELNFLKLMNCLSISPLAATAMTALLSPFLVSGQVWHLIIVVSVLFATCAPQNDHQMAFLHVEHPISVKSVQAITLIGLAAFNVWEVARVAFNPDADFANSVLQTLTPLPAAAGTIVNFWMVDKIGMALLYAFSVVHLPNERQRGFLLMVLFMKLGEYFYQIPRMLDPFQGSDIVESAALGSAVASGIAFFV